MLASNLLMTVTLGAAVFARAVEKSDRSIQEPINDPSSNRATSSPKSCAFTSSLPMPPDSFISTLPTSLHNYLPDILLSHSIFNSNLPPPSESDSTAPLASTISLSEETGDSSLQGIFLGLVYTPIGKPASQPPSSKSPPQNQESQPKPKPKCRRPRPTTAVTGEREDLDQSSGHANNLELRSPISSSSVPQSGPDMDMESCYAEAVEWVRESGMVEGTLEFADAGWRVRFLIWRAD